MITNFIHLNVILESMSEDDQIKILSAIKTGVFSLPTKLFKKYDFLQSDLFDDIELVKHNMSRKQ